MRILLVSSFLPYPLFSGGHIRLFNIIKHLSKRHKIYLVCEKRDYQTELDIKKIREICEKVVTVDRKKQWTFENIVKSGFSTNPFLIVGHTNTKMQEEIKILLEQNKFDLIHVETFYVYQNIPSKVNIPVVLIEHNIEYLVYKRFADKAPIFLRPLLYLDIAKLKRCEEELWKTATKLVAVSEQEKRLMKREDVVVVPNGVDLEKFKIQNSKFKVDKKEKRVLFIGDFKWIQNIDAVGWILSDIWPKIHNSKFMIHNSVKLWIVGRKIPDYIKKLTKDKRVIFDENAPSDTKLIYQKADILLAPIRVGGGTSFKILEAMASGIPVVTTHLGIEGINAKENKEALVSETPEGLKNHIINLLADEKLYKQIVLSARKFIEENYDWEKIVDKLEEVYKSAL